MAEEQVRNEDIFAKDTFDLSQNGIDAANKSVDALEASLNKLLETSQKVAASTPLDGYENIVKITAAVNNGKKAVQGLSDVEKAREKINRQIEQQQQRRIELSTDEAKELAKLRAEVNKQAKALRDEAKVSTEAADAFKDLTKRTNEAQAEYKRLAAQFGATSEEAAAALSKFQELDDELREINNTARDGRRDVGRYSTAFDDVSNSGGILGNVVASVQSAFTLLATNPLIAVAIALSAALGLVFKAFQRSESGARALAKTAAILEGVFGVVIKLVDQLVVGIIELANSSITFQDVWDAILDNITNRFNALLNVVQTQINVFKALYEAATTGDFTALGNSIKDAADNTIQLFTGLEDGTDILIDTAAAASELATEINKTADSFLALEEAQRAVRNENRELQVQSAKLAIEQEKLNALAESDGVALEEQLVLRRAAGALLEEQTQKEIKLAQNRFDIINREVKLRQANNEQIEDLLDERADAETALLDAQKEAALARIDNQDREVRALLDFLDQEQDVLEDAADKTKTRNETLAADEEASFERRRNALLRNGIDQKKALDATVKLTEDTANALRRIRGQSEDFKLPIEELLAIEDTVELDKRLRELGLVERQRLRLLPLINDQRQATQDLAIANRELLASERESAKVAADLVLLQEALTKAKQTGASVDEVRAELEEKRRAAEIEALQEEINLLEENSAKRLELERDLQEKLLELELDRIEKSNDAAEKAINDRLAKQQKALEKQTEQDEMAAEKQAERLEKQGERVSEFFDGIISGQQKRYESAIQELDDQIATAQSNLDRIRQEGGGSIAAEEEKIAQLQAERQQAVEAQARQEKILALIQVVSASIASGSTPAQALANAAATEAGIQSFVQGAFKDGTDRVSDDMPKLRNTGTDDHLAWVDGGEMIFNSDQSDQLRAMGLHTRADVLGAVANPTVQAPQYVFDTSDIVEGLNRIYDKPQLTDVQFHRFLGEVITTMNMGNKNVTVRSRV